MATGLLNESQHRWRHFNKRKFQNEKKNKKKQFFPIPKLHFLKTVLHIFNGLASNSILSSVVFDFYSRVQVRREREKRRWNENPLIIRGEDSYVKQWTLRQNTEASAKSAEMKYPAFLRKNNFCLWIKKKKKNLTEFKNRLDLCVARLWFCFFSFQKKKKIVFVSYILYINISFFFFLIFFNSRARIFLWKNNYRFLLISHVFSSFEASNRFFSKIPERSRAADIRSKEKKNFYSVFTRQPRFSIDAF